MPHLTAATGSRDAGHAYVPTVGQEEMLQDPGAWRGLYNQAMGIPGAGRSPYQNWLANQYGRAATQYALSQADRPGTGGYASFRDWLSPTGDAGEAATARRDPMSWLGSTALDAFAGYDPQRQRELMERIPTGGGFNPMETMLQSRFQTRGAPNWMARSLTRQALSEYPEFSISPAGGIAEGPDAPSFMGYLFDRYGLGTGTAGYESPWRLGSAGLGGAIYPA
jgi:hypothetical protein